MGAFAALRAPLRVRAALFLVWGFGVSVWTRLSSRRPDRGRFAPVPIPDTRGKELAFPCTGEDAILRPSQIGRLQADAKRAAATRLPPGSAARRFAVLTQCVSTSAPYVSHASVGLLAPGSRTPVARFALCCRRSPLSRPSGASVPPSSRVAHRARASIACRTSLLSSAAYPRRPPQ